MDLRSMQFAHDLKLPIQLIYSCVQLLELEVGPNDRAESYLRLLERSADQLQNMVRSAMNETPVSEALRTRPCDVVAEVRDVTRQCEPYARERGVKLTFRSNGAEFPMPLDVEKLDRILYNLLSNALRFTPAGGAVEASVELRGDAVDIAVADEGCGIPPERQGEIFELGVSDGGSGYGLNIVREYAALMGGSATVDSVPGRGSRFTVRLPVRGDALPRQ